MSLFSAKGWRQTWWQPLCYLPPLFFPYVNPHTTNGHISAQVAMTHHKWTNHWPIFQCQQTEKKDSFKPTLWLSPSYQIFTCISKNFKIRIKFRGRGAWVETGCWKENMSHLSAFLLWYGGWCLPAPLPPLPGHKDYKKICSSFVSCYFKATLVPTACLNSTKTLTPRLWFRFMVCAKAENQNNSARSCNEKRPANVKSKGSTCWGACDLFMAFSFTLSDARSCEAEH